MLGLLNRNQVVDNVLGGARELSATAEGTAKCRELKSIKNSHTVHE